MIAVIIPAHNEGAVLGRTLDALPAAAGHEPLEVIVVANGCIDDTVAVARARQGVTVLDIGPASKPAALNVGEQVVTGSPRIFLDADILPPRDSLVSLAEAVATPGGPMAAVPTRRVDLTGRPMAVRAYYSISQRLPAFRTGLFGRGMIALSSTGRARFRTFPEMIADDLFLDSLFETSEKTVALNVVVTVEAPLRTGDLVRRLVRVRRGNAAMRAAAGTGSIPAVIRPADRWAWLTSVVIPQPRLAPAAVVYVVITLWAALHARLTASRALTWERDESTRNASGSRGSGD